MTICFSFLYSSEVVSIWFCSGMPEICYFMSLYSNDFKLVCNNESFAMLSSSLILCKCMQLYQLPLLCYILTYAWTYIFTVTADDFKQKCLYWKRRNYNSREYTSGSPARFLTADFGVKTNAKLTPIIKQRETRKTGIQSCMLYTATLTPIFASISWRKFSTIQFHCRNGQEQNSFLVGSSI